MKKLSFHTHMHPRTHEENQNFAHTHERRTVPRQEMSAIPSFAGSGGGGAPTGPPRRSSDGGLLQEEEITLLELSNELEEVTGRMRRAVIDMVHRARDRLHDAAARELELRRAAQDLEHQQLIEQLDNMQALNVKHAQDTEDKQEFCDKLLAILFRLRGTNKEKSLMRRCLRAWHSIISRDSWVDRMGDYLEQQRERLLLRRVLQGWRNDAGRSSRDRKLANIRSLHDAELQRISADADLTSSAQKVELLGCKDQIARANEEKAILQERLKSHMMRGMCAMNAEATMLLRGMASESGMSLAMPENIPPPSSSVGAQPPFSHFMMNKNPTPASTMMMMMNQQPLPVYPEYGGVAGQGSSQTDNLLAMQGNINAQLSALQAKPEGYVAGQHSVNYASSAAAQQQPPRSPIDQLLAGGPSHNNSRATAGGSLVSFNSSHPALQSSNNNNNVNRPASANRLPMSQRSTPQRRL